MIIKRIKLIVIITICILSTEVLAQEKYKADLGILGGESFYLGDANKKLFNNMQVTFGGFLRYKINPRFAIKLELANTSIKGNFIGIDTTAYLNKSVNTGEIISEFNFFK